MTTKLSQIFERPERQKRLTIIVVLIWTAIVVFGFGTLVVYSQTPGIQSVPIQLSELDRRPLFETDRCHLVVGLHPKCSCSRATVTELQQILAVTGSTVLCTVYVYTPRQESSEWANTGLVTAAKELPGVELVFDPDGEAMAQFGVLTSGGVVLFDADGTVQFHGGITASRGHEGANAGSSAIRAIIQGSQSPVSSTPVYGCQIQGFAEGLR